MMGGNKFGVPKRQNNTNAVKFLANFIENIAFGGMEYFGKYYSSYRGIVASNEDPETLNRLKLIIPTVSGVQAYDYWAFPKHNFAGKDYGMQILPRKGDVVWVTFEGGNPELPLWEHGHFALKEKPTDDPELKDVNCYWFKSPGGILVKINDTKKTIHIRTKQGDYLEVNPSSISFVSDKKISLGTLNKSEYSGVLGEELRDLLKELIDILKSGKVLTTMGPQPFMPDTQTRLSLLKSKLGKFLSRKISLDK